MKIDVISLFPESLKPIGVMNRALKQGIYCLNLVDLRDFGMGAHKNVDDTVYGGGPGMLLRADVLDSALSSLNRTAETLVICPSARGVSFTQKMSVKLSQKKHLIFICGRYEGIDQRFIDLHVDLEVSIGPYVISGGELASAVIIDSVLRNIDGVLGNENSLQVETTTDLMEHSQYTRPSVFKNLEVPPILLSGNHELVEKYNESVAKTYKPKVRQEFLDA